MAEHEGGPGATPEAAEAAPAPSPVENPDLIALGTVLSGLATAVAGGSIAQATYLRDAGNYAVGSVLADTLAPLALFGGLFMLGAYLGASSFWLSAPRRSDIIPLRVAMGAVAAGALGFFVLSMVAAALPMGQALAASGSLLAAFYGARLTTFLRRAKPADRRLMLGRVGLTALSLLLATVLVTHRSHGFPGAAAPAAERDAWAQKTFKEHYAEAAARVKACGGLNARVGGVTSVAPTTGVNQVYYGPEAANGTFTLEVIGQTGSALVQAATLQPYAGKAATGALKTVGLDLMEAGRAVKLECL